MFHLQYCMSLKCSNSSEVDTLSTVGNETELAIPSLTPFTNYTVFVEGVTVDVGDRSVQVTVVTLEDGKRTENEGMSGFRIGLYLLS